MHVGVPTLYIGAYVLVECESLTCSHWCAGVLDEIYTLTGVITLFSWWHIGYVVSLLKMIGFPCLFMILMDWANSG